MLTGLSVYDGSLSASVKWRRVWWRCAGLGMLVVAAGVLAAALIWSPWRDGARTSVLWFGLPVAALAAALEGVRLLRRNRKSAANLRLHRWSLRAWFAAAVVASPESGMLLGASAHRRKSPAP